MYSIHLKTQGINHYHSNHQTFRIQIIYDELNFNMYKIPLAQKIEM